MESSALVYIVLTFATVLLACCIQNREYVPGNISGYRLPGQMSGICNTRARNYVAEFAIYALLAGVSVCRIAVGNDYWVYRDNFKLIAQDRHVSYEPGFNFVVKWMQELFGYDNYLPIFGLFSLVTVLFFVMALHDQASDYSLSLFLLMTGGYYFNSLNSVRYYFALAIALYSMKYVVRGEYAKFILWIVAGALFHKSILLVIPVYLVAKFIASVKLKKWHCIVGVLLILSLIFGQKLYREIIFYFYPFYRNSMFDNGQISYANIGKCLGSLVLCAICYKKSMQDNLRVRFYFYLNVAALLVYTCGSFIPEVSRVGYYMIISQVFLLPELLKDIEKGWFRKLCYVGVIGVFALYFVLLLRGMYDVNIRLLPYRNWIFQ